MEGWIKIYRDIKGHWIWKDPIKFQWWIDMLLTVNHSTAKVNIGMQLYECKRGQSIMSLSSWAASWNVSKDKVRNFFVLLEKDHMITHEVIGKSTRITICNYDSYQTELHDSSMINKRFKNDGQTKSHSNKNDKKEKNKENISKDIQKKDKLSFSEISGSEDYKQFRVWMAKNAPYCDNPKHFTSSRITEEELKKLREKYSYKQIINKILELENRKDLRKRYINLYRTINEWLKRDSNGR